MSELTLGRIEEFRIPQVPARESLATPEAADQPTNIAERIVITPDMESGILDYAVNHQTPYTDRQRAIAVSVLKHSFFLPAGRHSRPRR